MNVQTTGASWRPRLSLHFGGRSKPGAATTERRSPTLSDHELRRIVAAMVD